jgi:protein-S-isoprenylcysteine O-methyltransferase Ste14
MIQILIAFLLIISFIAIEGRLRKGEKSRSLEGGEFDRGSTTLIGASFGIAILVLLVASLLDYLRSGEVPDNEFVGWIGIILILAGLALRVWAALTLGEFYTRTLLITDRQRVVESGPYRLIRHPGYLGDIILWAGAALATANWIAIVLIIPLMVAAYTYRIRYEETMLLVTCGEPYRNYVARTRKLIPFIY